MSVRDFVVSVERHARASGITLSMARLRDAIARALWNRPYAQAIAAERAGKLPPYSRPPAFLEAAAADARLDATLLTQAFALAMSAPADDTAAPATPPILAASSLQDAVRRGTGGIHKRMRASLTMGAQVHAPLLLLTAGTVAGVAAAIARFAPELAQRDHVRVALFFSDPVVAAAEHGRALQLVPGWVGGSARFEFDCVRDDQSHDYGSINPVRGTPLQRFVAEESDATFFARASDYPISERRPDVVMVLYPAWIDEADQMKQATWLRPALAAGLPVLGMAYDAVEAEMIALTVAGYGLGSVEQYENPASTQMPVPGQAALVNHIGRYLFRIVPTRVSPDRKALATAQELRDVSRLLNERVPAELVGEVHVQQDARLLFGRGDRALELNSGRLYVATQDDDPRGLGLQLLEEGPEDWTPIPDDALPTLPYRLLMVQRAYREVRLFPKELFDPTEMKEDVERAARAAGLGPAHTAQLVAAMTGESGVDAELPLFVAAASDDAAAIHKALAAGADVDGRDAEGWTALAEAAKDNSVKALKALLSAGADPDLPTYMGHRPVTIAMSRGAPKAALALLEGGADPDAQSVNGTSARSLFEMGVCKSAPLSNWFKSHPAR